jgi:hypothetical protein
VVRLNWTLGEQKELSMKFAEFIKIMNAQYKKNKGGDIEFYLGESPITVKEMSRFGFVPDVVVRFEKVKIKKTDA